MNATIEPCKLSGTIELPASKSIAHRMLIAASLADVPTAVHMNAENADIAATRACLGALERRADVLDCGESGSTLRFLIPIIAALGATCTFIGAGRLPERPNAVLTEALRANGAVIDSDFLPMRVSGKLRGGVYALAGNVSSQYITGLLMALPLLDSGSEIRLTSRLESANYVWLTCDVLRQFGVIVEVTEGGYRIPGGQRYRSPGSVQVEGDWSAATFWLVANVMGHSVRMTGLNPDSAQGDRIVQDLLAHPLAALDVVNIPDAVPALAVAAALRKGDTQFVNAARLRLKESDRISATCALLRALGGSVTEHADGFTVHGGTPLTGGTVNGCNDHRIVIAAAVAATVADSPVTITDAEAVNKSYPGFFRDFQALGGKCHVE